MDGRELAELKFEATRLIRLQDGRLLTLDEHAQPLVLALRGPQGELQLEYFVPSWFEGCTPQFAPPADAEDYWEPLALQDSSAFAVADGIACIYLQDRNDNMASEALFVAVDLESGAVDSFVEFDPVGQCPDAPAFPACAGASSGEAWVEGASPADPASYAHSFDAASGWVSRAGEELLRLCPLGASEEPDFDPEWSCAQDEGLSPSGRFQLLSGVRSEGDYIYRGLFFLDLESATLSTVAGSPPAFIEVDAARLFDEGEGLSVVGESELVWLAEDRLWVDGLLLIPAQDRVVEVGGTLAYQLR